MLHRSDHWTKRVLLVSDLTVIANKLLGDKAIKSALESAEDKLWESDVITLSELGGKKYRLMLSLVKIDE